MSEIESLNARIRQLEQDNDFLTHESGLFQIANESLLKQNDSLRKTNDDLLRMIRDLNEKIMEIVRQ